MVYEKISKAVFTLAGVSISAVLCHAAATGQITGSIQTATGHPVAGATVAILVRPPAPGTTFTQFNGEAVTGSDGTFTVAGIPAGRFAVCVHAVDTRLLDPCVWSSEPTVTLAAGQLLTMPPIRLSAGVDFYVRVADPNGTLASQQGKIPGAALMLGVKTPNGIVVPVPVTATDSAGADHHVSVPPGTGLVFVAFSQAFNLTYGSSAINRQSGLSVPFQIPVTQTQLQETITVQ